MLLLDKNVMAPPILLPSDSIYAKFNMSTTPIVVEKYKLLLFTTEKIGSTALKQLCRRIMGETDYDSHSGGHPHVWPQNGLKYLNTFPIDKANEMVSSDEWTRAMFVRDPKERLLSGYLNWLPREQMSRDIINSAQQGLLNETLFKTRSGTGVGLVRCCKVMSNGDPNWEVLCRNRIRSFEGFLDIVEDGNIPLTVDSSGRQLWSPDGLRNAPACENKHWTPFTKWRMEAKFYKQLNFIGHLETVKSDIRRLLINWILKHGHNTELPAGERTEMKAYFSPRGL